MRSLGLVCSKIEVLCVLVVTLDWLAWDMKKVIAWHSSALPYLRFQQTSWRVATLQHSLVAQSFVLPSACPFAFAFSSRSDWRQQRRVATLCRASSMLKPDTKGMKNIMKKKLLTRDPSMDANDSISSLCFINSMKRRGKNRDICTTVQNIISNVAQYRVGQIVKRLDTRLTWLCIC